jgi:predicted metal-dependent phosphoesterase TrpH
MSEHLGIYREGVYAEHIAEEGPTAVDMHLYSNYSDSPTKVVGALGRVRKLGIGLAITDQNTISGSEEALATKSGVLVSPVSRSPQPTAPHIQLYFYDRGSMPLSRQVQE